MLASHAPGKRLSTRRRRILSIWLVAAPWRAASRGRRMAAAHW